MPIITPKTCPYCGKSYTCPDPRQIYCSKACGRLHQLPPIEDRLWAKVQRSTPVDCWEWTGARTPAGYGTISYQNRHQYVHRLIYEIARGPIPDGMFVCHSCDNPACCNPAHLWIGTQGDNNRDMFAKGRSGVQQRPETTARGERQGSAKLTEQAVREIRELASQGYSSRVLAARFNVSRTTIKTIVNRKWWKHVT